MNFCLYVVATGKFEEDTTDHNEYEGKHLVHERGNVFGEVALMHGSDNHSRVVALEDSTCWAIDRFKFQTVARDIGKGKLEEFTSFLRKVELLSPLAEFERAKIAEALEEVQQKKD